MEVRASDEKEKVGARPWSRGCVGPHLKQAIAKGKIEKAQLSRKSRGGRFGGSFGKKRRGNESLIRRPTSGKKSKTKQKITFEKVGGNRYLFGGLSKGEKKKIDLRIKKDSTAVAREQSLRRSENLRSTKGKGRKATQPTTVREGRASRNIQMGEHPEERARHPLEKKGPNTTTR